MMDLTTAQWVKHAIIHPFEGYEDMRWKKSGSLKVSFIIVLLFFIASIAHNRLYGFQFRVDYDKTFNIIPYIVQSIGIFITWVIGNWAICTLLDGEGSMRKIFIYSAYALIPYISQIYINVILSHILIQDEFIFMQVIQVLGTGWTVLLIFSAIKVVHQYTFKKTILAIVLTLTTMAIILLLIVLLLSLFQQIFLFIYSLYTEISYKIRV